MVVVQRPDGAILLTKRTDDGHWCLPAGGAEIGGSFASTAIAELAEEAGLEVEVEDLIPFGTLSEAATHTNRYPNGDVTHCFALLFVARRWKGTPTPDGREATETRFAQMDALPEPLQQPAATAIELFRKYLATDRFQLA
jgi:8-oxo-dGTP pyrophosphatase MutT (NUDIX family)